MPKARVQNIKGIDYVYIESSHRVVGRHYPNHTRLYIGKMTSDGFSPNAKFHALSIEEKKATGVEWNASSHSASTRPRGRPLASSIGVSGRQ